jgi:hypothetical protein
LDISINKNPGTFARGFRLNLNQKANSLGSL